MMMPSVFGESLFDQWMKNFWEDTSSSFSNKNEHKLMKTDIRELDGNYLLEVEIPGVKKEDVKAEIDKGYLTVKASSNTENSEKDKDGRFIRRERYIGQYSRTFLVGEHINQEDIKAKFEDGILKLSFPKKEVKEIEKEKYIAIE